MEFTETKLRGAFLIGLQRIEDHRGYFARGWCTDELAAHGLTGRMVQLNAALSHRSGTLRGLHYQEAPHEEAKLIRCTRGAIFDVIVDLRPTSETFGRWLGVELTAENGRMLYVPEHFAHGYQTLCDETETYYLTSSPYAASAARGLHYSSPALGITWPLAVSVVSDADEGWPDDLPGGTPT